MFELAGDEFHHVNIDAWLYWGLWIPLSNFFFVKNYDWEGSEGRGK